MPAQRKGPRPVNKEFVRVKTKPGSSSFTYEVTKAGIAEAHAHARRGGTVKELALLFRVPERSLYNWIGGDPDGHGERLELAEAWHSGRYEFLGELREKQLALAETNGAVSIHLGKHNLEQHDRPQEVNHLHRVVGTLPDYDQTSDAWRKQFAPQPVLDGGKLIEQEIEEAEYEDASEQTDTHGSE